jgi:hypothetical protein
VVIQLADGILHDVTAGMMRADAAARDQFLRRLWLPLPLEHPRTRLWIRDRYRQSAHCFLGADGTLTKLLLWPVPAWQLTHVGILEPVVPAVLQAHPDLAATWLAREREVYAARKRDYCTAVSRLCTPERHVAVHAIRQFYPEHQPDLTLLEHPPTQCEGSWWETEAEQPTPATCQPRNGWRHPVNGTWCRWCGWRPESPPAEPSC